jgi:hypothetical protein
VEARFRRILASLALAVSVVSAGVFGAALVNGGSLASRAPTASTPPRPFVEAIPGAYDAADGYDVWLLPHGATWTYSHGAWTNRTATAGGPFDPAGNYELAYDAHDGYVLYFGGSFGRIPTYPLNDTWKFSAGHWTNLTGTVHGAPSARTVGAMAYDSEDQEVVLFGGTLAGSPRPINETWTYAAEVWTNATVPGPPPSGLINGRGPYLAFTDDPADGYVLYYQPVHGCSAGQCGPEAWSYHAGVWTNRTTGLGDSPRLNLFGSFTFDSTANEVVAFGACMLDATTSCSPSWGTFRWANGHWVSVAPAQTPPPAYSSGWASDPPDGGLIMIYGCCWADFSGLSELWQDAWIFAHGTWTETRPWGGAPPPVWDNDGFWLGVAVLAAAGAVLALRRRPPKVRP